MASIDGVLQLDQGDILKCVTDKFKETEREDKIISAYK
jgi:hypothetical protein